MKVLMAALVGALFVALHLSIETGVLLCLWHWFAEPHLGPLMVSQAVGLLLIGAAVTHQAGPEPDTTRVLTHVFLNPAILLTVGFIAHVVVR